MQRTLLYCLLILRNIGKYQKKFLKFLNVIQKKIEPVSIDEAFLDVQSLNTAMES